MDEDSPEARRSLKFWLWALLAAVNVFTVSFFIVMIVRPQSVVRPQTKLIKRYAPAPPDEILKMVAYINGPKRAIGHIKNIQVPAAKRLEAAGPSANAYGAAEALTTLIATTDDPEAKEAAEAALKSIEGR